MHQAEFEKGQTHTPHNALTVWKNCHSHMESHLVYVITWMKTVVGAIIELAMRRGGASTHKANNEHLMDKYRALLDLGGDLRAMHDSQPAQQQ